MSASFLRHLDSIYTEEKGYSSKAWRRFLELGLPERRDEAYRYVKMRPLYERAPTLPPASGSSKVSADLLFENGKFISTSLPDDVVVLPFREAFKTYGTFLHGWFNEWLKEERDPMALLGGAFAKEGVLIYLPPGVVLEKPVTIHHHMSDAGASVAPSSVLYLGKGASMTCAFSESGTALLHNQSLHISLEERANLTFNRLFVDAANRFDTVRAQLKKASLLKMVTVSNGGALERSNYSVKLLGEEASASLYGFSQLEPHRQGHVHVHMEHVAPHCHSLQTFKHLLHDQARSSFEGKIYVHKEAQKTEAYQVNHNLLMGKRASANSKPNLEIFADDVKASHGATMGQVDEEQLFYFLSRGIPRERAVRLLLKGFSQEVFDQISDQDFKTLAENAF